MNPTPHPAHLFVPVLFVLLLAACAGPEPEAPFDYENWSSYLGDKGSSQYSTLDQINRDNVDRLQVAWTYSTGDQRGDRSQIQCNPIIIDSVLYDSSLGLKVFALDAATGRARWTFDPFAEGGEASELGVNRGVVYWQDEAGGDRRILFTAGGLVPPAGVGRQKLCHASIWDGILQSSVSGAGCGAAPGAAQARGEVRPPPLVLGAWRSRRRY